MPANIIFAACAAPCVVLSLFRHNLKGQIVKVAPVRSPRFLVWISTNLQRCTKLTSRPLKSLGEYIPISPVNIVNGFQLSLRNNRTLDKQSYVKMICFEIDFRMLALYNGVGADTFRLTKRSMKMLSAKMPPVIEWAPQPVSSSSNRNIALPDDGSAHRTTFAPERLSRDIEAQPLLGQPDSLVTEYGSSGFSGKSSYVAGTQRTQYIAESTFKLVLCVPVLLVLIACVIARFILDFMLRGPVTTYDAAAKLLLSLWKNSLADVVGNC